jgi:hypothetical protein
LHLQFGQRFNLFGGQCHRTTTLLPSLDQNISAITEGAVMADTWNRRDRPAQLADHRDVLQEMKDSLEALGHVDRAYGSYRVMLERWSGSTSEKDRLRDLLDKFHRQDREPFVVRLTDLHDQMTKSASETFH